jgi:hypothetical protein
MKIEQNASRSGLCTTMGYDPCYARAQEELKRTLLSGHPILMRLHPGADYELPPDKMYEVDLEGQAILVTGYDDETREFIVHDPWSKELGAGPSGKRRIGYWELAYRMVNSSKGYWAVLAPPIVEARVDGDDIVLSVGLYTPDVNIMDVASSWLDNIELTIVEGSGLELGDGERVLVQAGQFAHGECATFRVPARILARDPELVVSVAADYVAERPYVFRERVTTDVKISRFATNDVVVPLAAGM